LACRKRTAQLSSSFRRCWTLSGNNLFRVEHRRNNLYDCNGRIARWPL
jgi:hypothetical protein